jgi:hypothetical protein
LLKIKKSHINGFILYNPENFKQHTHIQKLEIAFVVKRNVEKSILPKTDNAWLLESHIRVSSDKAYIAAIQAKIDSLK